jgi:peptide chain release factor 1
VWSGGDFESELLEVTPGFASFLVRGEGAEEFFNEAGGHRVQHVSPTDKNKRVHTSTITVAVLSVKGSSTCLHLSDVEIITTRGSGPGGQHRNKVETCVIATHKPSGLSVRIDGRSQVANKKTALEVLATRIEALQRAMIHSCINKNRQDQVGSGQRGDKIRTYRVRDNLIIDHRTGKKWRFDQWILGIWE